MLSELLISILSAIGRLGSLRNRDDHTQVDRADEVDRPDQNDLTSIYVGGHCP